MRDIIDAPIEIREVHRLCEARRYARENMILAAQEKRGTPEIARIYIRNSMELAEAVAINRRAIHVAGGVDFVADPLSWIGDCGSVAV